MRVFELFDHLNIVQLDIEKLVNRFESTTNRDVVLELDSDFVVHERFEKAMEYKGQRTFSLRVRAYASNRRVVQNAGAYLKNSIATKSSCMM